jgi:hypothetical protein
LRPAPYDSNFGSAELGSIAIVDLRLLWLASTKHPFKELARAALRLFSRRGLDWPDRFPLIVAGVPRRYHGLSAIVQWWPKGAIRPLLSKGALAPQGPQQGPMAGSGGITRLRTPAS